MTSANRANQYTDKRQAKNVDFLFQDSISSQSRVEVLQYDVYDVNHIAVNFVLCRTGRH